MLDDTRIQRVIIDRVRPEIDGGRFPIKRTLGEKVKVRADILTDGHDAISGLLLFRHERSTRWRAALLEGFPNDKWKASFKVTELGRYVYTVCAWLDRFKSWRRDLAKRLGAGQDVAVDLLTGAALVEEALPRAGDPHRTWLADCATCVAFESKPGKQNPAGARPRAACPHGALSAGPHANDLLSEGAGGGGRSGEGPVQRLVRDVPALLQPDAGSPRHIFRLRGQAALHRRHGLRRALPCRPSTPSGPPTARAATTRRSANREIPAAPGPSGPPRAGTRRSIPNWAPWTIFETSSRRPASHGLDVAMDLAFQCSPDHPYVREHPEWFQQRPDGSIQYAENPPKKYEDIYPLHFECAERRALMDELKRVVLFWIDQGIRIFRVDNPHTKPFAFWEWLIGEVKRSHPEVIFLAEAFTRPKVMYRLAKLGFSQSYTYFAWRNTAWEIKKYFTELTQTDVAEFFRPNLWPNTPDILTEHLQTGGPPAFAARLVLAATLGANYGIYGPAFELCEDRPREPGSEEYLNSEKFEIRTWDIDSPGSLKDLIARVNRIRRDNPALHGDRSLRFHPVDNEQLICYSKHTADFSNVILTVVNLDPHHTHSGWLELPLSELGLDTEALPGPRPAERGTLPVVFARAISSS